MALISTVFVPAVAGCTVAGPAEVLQLVPIDRQVDDRRRCTLKFSIEEQLTDLPAPTGYCTLWYEKGRSVPVIKTTHTRSLGGRVLRRWSEYQVMR
jgi:hypothetical protein